VCCSVGGSCNFVTNTFWQCQPDGWARPVPKAPEYDNATCSATMKKVGRVVA
jgi:hypothetical protein